MIIMSNIFCQWFGADWYWLSAILSEPFDSSFNGITASCWKTNGSKLNNGWSVGVSWSQLEAFAGCRLEAFQMSISVFLSKVNLCKDFFAKRPPGTALLRD